MQKPMTRFDVMGFLQFRRFAPSAPPLGELLSEREAEGVRNESTVRCKIRTTPSQSARSGCQLSQRESQGRFAPGVVQTGF